MSKLGLPSARRSRQLILLLGAATLTSLAPFGSAQGNATGDIRFTLTGGDHAGEHVLTGVPLFLCGFGFTGPGSFSLQYFAEDPEAAPSSVQVSLDDVEDPGDVNVAEVVIGFGDLLEDGIVYSIWTAEGMGSVESQVTDGDSATVTLEGQTSDGVGISLQATCRGVGRFSD